MNAGLLSKPCVRCGATDRVPSDGDCRPCKRAHNAPGRYKANPLTSRRCHLRKTFGMTLEAFDQMFEQQEGLCLICSTLMVKGGTGRTSRSVAVDHDHATGKVRGLLCRPCNTGIGHLRDNPRIVRNGAAYLEGTN